MRADFVANLAHEMRTPVASLSLAAETLSTDLPPHEQRRFIERIAEETKRDEPAPAPSADVPAKSGKPE